VVGGSPTWIKATNPSGSGLRLGNIVSNCVEVSGAVLNTAQSFTVMARVSLDVMEAGKYQTFVSIDGRQMSGFALQFDPYAGASTGRFEFTRLETDSKTATKTALRDKSPITTNTWYHLAAVYDADVQEMDFYMDGNLQTALPFAHGWQAVGKTAIGRALNGGKPANYTRGIIRDVRLYASALTAEQIKKLAE
jgi:hypothetical protein